MEWNNNKINSHSYGVFMCVREREMGERERDRERDRDEERLDFIYKME